MTAEIGEAVRGDAVRWHLRLADGSAADWEAFVAWLEESPDHAQAYDTIEALDAEDGEAIAAAIPPTLVAANDDAPVRSRRWWYGGSAVAAAVAVAAVVGPRMTPARDLYQVASAAGETRDVVLASGDRITLNGGSAVLLDRNNLRYASLQRGEAAFGIRHNPASPFVVDVGDERIQDVGTVFNVARSDDGVHVAVAEGEVLYNPGREAVRLTAGQALSDPGGSNVIQLAKVDPAAVGSWRTGRLSYAATPLSRIAADLSRAIGQPVRLGPALAGRRFTGTIRIRRDRAALFSDVALLLDVEARRDGGGWTLVAHPRAGH